MKTIPSLLVAYILLFFAFFGCKKTANTDNTPPAGTDTVVIDSTIRLMIPILNAENPEHDIQIIKPFLRSNDILVFPVSQYTYADSLKNEITGLTLATGGTSISTLLPGISYIPSDVEYVTYDYERGHCPEWTRNQDTSIHFFDTLRSSVSAYYKKLVITPAWIYNPNFDWGEIAKHTDILLVQVQNFQTGAVVPPPITPDSLGINLAGVTQLIVSEVRAKSPSTPIFLQFGFDVTKNPDNILNDIRTVRGLGINGIALWYNPGTSDSTSNIGLLQTLLQKITRVP